METADSIGGRIHARLRERNRSSTWLAGKIGVRERTVERWADGLHDPRSGQIAGIAQALEVSVAWVLLGREDPAVEQFIREGREDGIPPDEIIDAMIGLGNTARADEPTEARDELPADAPRAPLRSAEVLGRRPGGRASKRKVGRPRPQAPRPPRNPDEDPPS